MTEKETNTDESDDLPEFDWCTDPEIEKFAEVICGAPEGRIIQHEGMYLVRTADESNTWGIFNENGQHVDLVRYDGSGSANALRQLVEDLARQYNGDRDDEPEAATEVGYQ